MTTLSTLLNQFNPLMQIDIVNSVLIESEDMDRRLSSACFEYPQTLLNFSDVYHSIFNSSILAETIKSDLLSVLSVLMSLSEEIRQENYRSICVFEGEEKLIHIDLISENEHFLYLDLNDIFYTCTLELDNKKANRKNLIRSICRKVGLLFTAGCLVTSAILSTQEIVNKTNYHASFSTAVLKFNTSQLLYLG